jgi:hypothetical protein
MDPEIASSGNAQSLNDNGTTAQGQLGKAPARRHFFASLDATAADAVKSDAERVTYTEEEEVSHLHLFLSSQNQPLSTVLAYLVHSETQN